MVRRYEFYEFTGIYDPLTHEAICAHGLCNTPAPAELGGFIGAQNAAANLNVPPQQRLTVTAAGNRQVQDSTGTMRWPSACSLTAATGTVITLTIFAGWGGACAGTDLTCSVTLDSSAAVSATFVALFNLSVSRSGKGVITSAPAGIGCGLGGGGCSAKFAAGTVVTLTATPDPGSIWTGWSGACSGTASTCQVTLAKDTSVQANFK